MSFDRSNYRYIPPLNDMPTGSILEGYRIDTSKTCIMCRQEAREVVLDARRDATRVGTVFLDQV
jgi:hypothetical protein